MYTEQDYSDICAQIKQRRLLLSIPAALLLAGVIVSFVFRVRWITTALSLVLGAGIIAGRAPPPARSRKWKKSPWTGTG